MAALTLNLLIQLVYFKLPRLKQTPQSLVDDGLHLVWEGFLIEKHGDRLTQAMFIPRLECWVKLLLDLSLQMLLNFLQLSELWIFLSL